MGCVSECVHDLRNTISAFIASSSINPKDSRSPYTNFTFGNFSATSAFLLVSNKGSQLPFRMSLRDDSKGIPSYVSCNTSPDSRPQLGIHPYFQRPENLIALLTGIFWEEPLQFESKALLEPLEDSIVNSATINGHSISEGFCSS